MLLMVHAADAFSFFQAAVSMSDGSVCLVSVDASGVFCKTRQWQAHDMEAWIVGFDYHNPNVLYRCARDRAPPANPQTKRLGAWGWHALFP